MSNLTQLRCSVDLEDLRLRPHVLETRDSVGRYSGSVAFRRRVPRGQGALDLFTRSSCSPAVVAEMAGSCSEEVAMAPPALDLSEEQSAGSCSKDVVMASPALEESAGSCSDEDDDEDRVGEI